MSGGDANGDGLSVRSGAGGTAALLEDLDAAAHQLRLAGVELGEIAFDAWRVATDPVALTSVALSPGTGAAAEAATARLVGSGGGITWCAGRTQALSVSLRAAVELYRGADTVAAFLLEQISAGVTMAIAPARPAVTAVVGAGVAVVAATGQGSRLLSLLGSVPGLGDQLVAHLPRVLLGLGGVGIAGPNSPPELAVATQTAAASGMPALAESGRVGVREGPSQTQVPPSGLAQVAERIQALDPERGGSPGTLRIERIDGPDGARAWIVEIPGTQTWAPTSTNPFDVTSDAASMAGRTTAASAVVLAALKQRGVSAGEPVVLVGHSLGGMTAAQVAISVERDPALKARVNITHVVTMGSPIGAMPVPRHVEVLSMEHPDDPVPWLDGASNPDAAHRVTVRDEPVAGQSIPSGHSLVEYERTATRVDASNDPSIGAWRQGTQVFFDRPGATSTVWEVSGERLPP